MNTCRCESRVSGETYAIKVKELIILDDVIDAEQEREALELTRGIQGCVRYYSAFRRPKSLSFVLECAPPCSPPAAMFSPPTPTHPALPRPTPPCPTLSTDCILVSGCRACPRGNLAKNLECYWAKPYTRGRARDTIASLLRALSHLHDAGIAHMNLQPRNFLLRGDGFDDVCLSNFKHSTAECALLSYPRSLS